MAGRSSLRAYALVVGVTAVFAGGCHRGIAVDLGPDRREVGFGTEVILSARVRGAGRQASFRWEQVAGPDVTHTMKGERTPSLTFRTLTLEELGVLEDRPHVVAFSPWTAGEYRFRLTVEDGDRRGRAEVLVTATGRHGGVSGIPVGASTWLSVPRAEAYAWRIVKAPRDSHATLELPSARATRLRPDVVGQYIVEETRSGVQFNLYAGRYADVPKDCGRSACHPAQGRGFRTTAHASVMQRGLTGQLRGRGLYRKECLRCHATGYDEQIDSGGFDDEARRIGWAFPSERALPKAGVTGASSLQRPLPNPLRGLANVTCLSCHGPGKLNYSSLALGRSVVWGIGQCAVCHDAPPTYTHVAEWRRSPMNVRVERSQGPAVTPGCAACHSAQGFIAAVRGDPMKAPGLVRAESITCPACHDPHEKKHEGQLRLPVETLCIRCHSSDARTHLPPSPFPAPHAPQADLVAGRGAKPVPGLSVVGGPHTRVAKGCAGCHMARGTSDGILTTGGHTFRARRGDSENIVACAGHCHPGRERFDLRAREDFDGDGVLETNRQEVQGLLRVLEETLAQRLRQRAARGCGGEAVGVGTTDGHVVLVNAEGRDLGDCNGDGRIAEGEKPFVLPETMADLYPAAYNYLLVKRDRSHGLHNLPFAVDVLRASLGALVSHASHGMLNARRTAGGRKQGGREERKPEP